MEYKGYKIESIKNDGHLQRNAFGIYKNGKLISTATTSKEAQHEIDDIESAINVDAEADSDGLSGKDGGCEGQMSIEL